MKDRTKKKNRWLHRGIVFCFVAALTAGLVFAWTSQSQAADELHITCNGAVLDPAATISLNTSSMQLMAETTGTAYDDARYKVEWSIEDTEARNNIASIEQSATNKMIAIVRALSPGTVTVTVTVKDAMNGDAVLGSTTCNINVMFGVDTSNNDTIFKKMFETDTDRSLVLYADDAPVQMGLNFGKVEDAQWSSDNEEIVQVGRKNGVVTPRGAGHTQITATYTPEGDTSTYTAVLNVYVIPKVSLKDGSGYAKSLTDLKIPSGTAFYTDTRFDNTVETISDKISWVVKADNGNGNTTVLADSLGKTSDVISVKPANAYKNELVVSGVAGNYFIELYTKGTYNGEADGEHTTAYKPTVISFTLTADIGDKEETLGPGDSYDLAAAFGMSTEDFVKCFNANNWTKDGGSIYNYGSYDANKAVLTVKKTVSEGILKNKITVRPEQKAYVAALMGLDSSNPDIVNSIPTVFNVTINLKDQITLNTTRVTLTPGATYQLFATYNGAYDSQIQWSSSDSSYVTVDENGLLKGVRITSGDITVEASITNSQGKTITARCIVVVEKELDDFKLNPGNDFTMHVGETKTVKAEIPQNITNAPLKWKCSETNDPNFTVEPASDGKSAVITAKKVGNAHLIVTNTATGTDISVRITVVSNIENISLKNNVLTVPFYKQGYNMRGDVAYTPTTANATDLVWNCSDPSVATVDGGGYVEFKTAGTVLITVWPKYNPNGVMASCLLTISGSPTSITLSTNTVSMNVGDIQIIDVEFAPTNTTTVFNQITPTVDGIANVTYDEAKHQFKVQGAKPGKTYLNIVSVEGIVTGINVDVKRPATKISLSPKNIALRTGDTATVKATLTPADTTDTIQWTTMDARVATVNENGVITGVKAGTTFIKAQTFNGTIAGPIDMIQVTVQDGVKSVSLDSQVKTVEEGSSIIIKPTFNPTTAFDQSMTWTTSNAGIAKVENSGASNAKVTGVKVGTVLITGKSTDGGFTVSCLVTVTPKKVANDTKVKVKPKTKYLQLKKTFYIKATVTGSSNKKVKWKSSKKSVATVSSSGKVKGKKLGTAYITATAKDGSGAYARCKVRVVRKVKKLKLNKYTAKVYVGSTLKLKSYVAPKNASVKKVKWSSSDKTLATVSSSGRVLGVAPGIVKITAKTKDGSNKKATCILTVKEPIEATGVSVENATLTVAKGRAAMSGIAAEPAGATTGIKYYSDNPSVATVDRHGKIRTKQAGQATIYGETANGKIGYCEVQVVDLNRKGMNIRQYDTEQLYVNDISTGVTWYSKNSSIASITSSGLVTGRKKGTTTVYAVVNGVKLGCRVKVRKIK